MVIPMRSWAAAQLQPARQEPAYTTRGGAAQMTVPACRHDVIYGGCRPRPDGYRQDQIGYRDRLRARLAAAQQLAEGVEATDEDAATASSSWARPPFPATAARASAAAAPADPAAGCPAVPPGNHVHADRAGDQWRPGHPPTGFATRPDAKAEDGGDDDRGGAPNAAGPGNEGARDLAAGQLRQVPAQGTPSPTVRSGREPVRARRRRRGRRW